MNISISKLFITMCVACALFSSPTYASETESETVDKSKLDTIACWFVCPPDVVTD